MNKIITILVAMISLSTWANDYEQVKKCEGINQFNKSVTAKLYLDVNNSSRGLLILMGLSDNTKFEAISVGLMNIRGDFEGERVRLTNNGFLHHADYYPLRGNLYCDKVNETTLISIKL